MTNTAEDSLSMEVIEQAARTLKILSHPHRLRIVEMLERQAREMPVHLITERLGIPQAAVSRHLGTMSGAGLLSRSRRGQEVWYGLKDNRSLAILHCMRNTGEDQ